MVRLGLLISSNHLDDNSVERVEEGGWGGNEI